MINNVHCKIKKSLSVMNSVKIIVLKIINHKINSLKAFKPHYYGYKQQNNWFFVYSIIFNTNFSKFSQIMSKKLLAKVRCHSFIDIELYLLIFTCCLLFIHISSNIIAVLKVGKQRSLLLQTSCKHFRRRDCRTGIT